MAARQFPLQRLMELETDERCGTAPAADARRSESGFATKTRGGGSESEGGGLVTRMAGGATWTR